MKTLFPQSNSRNGSSNTGSQKVTNQTATSSDQNAAVQRKLITFAQAAEQMSVSLNHVRNLIKDGHLTVINVGTRSRRLRASDIDDIVNNGIPAR